MEEKFNPHEIALSNIVMAKNEFAIDLNRKKKDLERKIVDFRKSIKSPELLHEFDNHFGVNSFYATR